MQKYETSEKFEDIKGVIRSYKSKKHQQCKGQKHKQSYTEN